MDGIASITDTVENRIAITDPYGITLNLTMTDMVGLQLLDRIMAHKRRPVILLSSRTVLGGRVQAECMTRGAAACFNKSHIICEAPQLIRLIHRVTSGKLVREEEPVLV